MFDVVVLGGGMIGLTTARRFQQRGARVCVVTDRPVEATTSHLAAAVWYPTETEADEKVLDWAGRTFEVFARQAGSGVPGVRMCPTRMLHRDGVDEDPWWSAVVPHFRTVASESPFTSAWEFTVPLVEMPVYLAWLRDQFVAAGGTVNRRRVGAIAELADWAPIVVNASGLAARTLCGDDAVTAARGQIVVASNPGLVGSVRDEANPAGRTYVHPRSRDVIIGGTYDLGCWDTDVDERTAQDLWRRAVGLVPELRHSRIRSHHVGLRPVRIGGARLAADRVDVPGRVVVHNYGHGGAGMTLSWGCAEAAVGIAVAESADRNPNCRVTS